MTLRLSHVPAPEPPSTPAEKAGSTRCTRRSFAPSSKRKDIGKEEVLLQISASVGLEREGLRFALEEGRYTEKVHADEELAHRLDVGSVPTMFVGLAGQLLEKAEAIVDAQSYDGLIEAAVEQALSRH